MMQHPAAIRETLLATATKGMLVRDVAVLQERDAVRALATEIDRTILPCRINVRLEDGTSFYFLVRNRRLHGVGAEQRQTLPTQFRDGKLSADLAHDLIQWMSSLFRTSGLVRVDRNDLEPDDDLSSLGISPARLSLATGLDLDAPAQLDLETLMESAIQADPSRIFAAFLMAGDEVSAIHGTPDVVEQQTEVTLDLLAHVTAKDSALSGQLETDGLLLTPHPIDKDRCIAIIGSLGFIGLIILNDITLADAARWWRSAKEMGKNAVEPLK